ncbi:hypothetical protein HD554DRAFT_1248975 [Boletus coccyginus]|nr:hypothetical protein HD554DRAFT_1248975 [Boletus coccyginus]
MSLRCGIHVTIVIQVQTTRMTPQATTKTMEKEGETFVNYPHLFSAADFLSGGVYFIFEPAESVSEPSSSQANDTVYASSTQGGRDGRRDPSSNHKGCYSGFFEQPEQPVQHAQRYVSEFTAQKRLGSSSASALGCVGGLNGRMCACMRSSYATRPFLHVTHCSRRRPTTEAMRACHVVVNLQRPGTHRSQGSYPTVEMRA